MLARPADFLDVLKCLRASPGIAGRQASDARSAVRTVGRLLLNLPRRPTNAELASISIADPAALNRQLDALSSDTQITSKSLGHTISRFRRALSWAGLEIADGRGRWPLTASWGEFLEGLEPASADALFEFASWSGARQISPGAVTQRAFENYQSALLANRPLGSVMQTIRRVKRTWNRVASSSNLALEVLSVPGVTVRRYLRRDIPEPLLKDLDQSLVEPHPSALIARKPASKTLLSKRNYLGRFTLSEYRNLVGNYPKSLEELLVVQAAREILTIVKRRTGQSGTGHSPYAYELARFLCNLAEWRHPDDYELTQELEQLRLEHAPEDLSLSERKSDFLRYFADYQNVERLKTFPFRHYGGLIGKRSLERQEYTELTVAFAMYLMMVVPLRPGIVCAATIGPQGNVREQGRGHARRVVLRWDRSVNSSAGPLEYVLTGEDLILYDQYTTGVRAHHPSAATTAFLFPGRRGQHKSAAWFSQQMAQFTAREDVLGIRINASLLRLALAFIQLVRNPEDQKLAASYLGCTREASLDALQKHVAGWRKSGAFRNWPIGELK